MFPFDIGQMHTLLLDLGLWLVLEGKGIVKKPDHEIYMASTR